MILLTLTAFLTLASYSQISPALAEPSFSCAKASTAAEGIICGNEELSDLDREIDELFSWLIRHKPQSPVELHRAQKEWIQHREACAVDSKTRNPAQISCIRTIYQARLKELNSIGDLVRTVDSKQTYRNTQFGFRFVYGKNAFIKEIAKDKEERTPIDLHLRVTEDCRPEHCCGFLNISDELYLKHGKTKTEACAVGITGGNLTDTHVIHGLKFSEFDITDEGMSHHELGSRSEAFQNGVCYILEHRDNESWLDGNPADDPKIMAKRAKFCKNFDASLDFESFQLTY